MFGTMTKHQDLVQSSKFPQQRAQLLKRSSFRLKQKVNTMLTKSDLLQAQSNLRNKSRKSDSSGEFDKDLEGWKENLSQEDKSRLTAMCSYNPFGSK